MQAALAGWDREFKKVWTGSRTKDVPKPHADPATWIARIWDWILPLQRYGECPATEVLGFLDQVREMRKNRNPDDVRQQFQEAAENPMLAKAAFHLWEGRDFSLVFDPYRAGIQGTYRYTPTPHFGYPTSNIIGLSAEDRRAVYSLVDILVVAPGETTPMFDLSIVAAMIMSYERFWRKLPDLAAVKKKIMDPLLRGEDLLDDFY